MVHTEFQIQNRETETVNSFVKKASVLLLAAAMVISFAGCSKNNAGESTSAACKNGVFKGAYEEETGVLSFKGIPYAKAPVGELRWKAPQPPDDSDEVLEAYNYGKSGIQYYWHSEAITTDVGEDCLTLNVWTDSLDTQDKAVMVFFHGGAFAWGGSSEPLYNGQYIVDTHEDVIVVTCNYRIGIMGFANFSGVEGSEDFPDTENLGLLDCIQALQWINENIKAFGGDPDNVTIFGESAGGTICSSLLLTDAAGDLFQRAIVESGPIGLTISEEKSVEYSNNVQMLMEYTGAENMDDLMDLTEAEIIEANEYEWDEDGTTLNDCYKTIVRGVEPVPADPYELYRTGNAKNVDLMIGTTLDEMNYWVNEMGDAPITELSDEEIEENVSIFNDYFIAPIYETARETVSEEDLTYIDKYMELYSDMEEPDAKARFVSDLCFRASSVKMAEEHSNADGTGKTYMYLFEKENTEYEAMKACHASELAYVFHNLGNTEFTGKIDEGLADRICDAWVNFAKSGNPSTEAASWEEYSEEDRITMIIGNDNALETVKDPYSAERSLLANLTQYYLIPAGA